MVKLAFQICRNAPRARQARPSSCDFYFVLVAHKAAHKAAISFLPLRAAEKKGVMEVGGVLVIDVCEKERSGLFGLGYEGHEATVCGAHARCDSPPTLRESTL